MIKALKSNERLFELFTKKEEYEPQSLDQYKRFLYKQSKHRDVLKPEISEFLIQNGLKIEYPDDKKFGVCLTHDIDLIYFATPLLKKTYGLVEGLRRLPINSSHKLAGWTKINNKYNPKWNFEFIMNLEEKYGAKSSFYFLSLEPGDQDFGYRIDELEGELSNIADNGWEIGLHGGHEAYHDLSVIQKEKERLEGVIKKEIIGYRNHLLKISVPTTWELLNKVGFKYDTTFGYPDHVGFRNGMCHPFKPFNLNTNNYIDILEIPLTVMEETLFRYMQLDIKNAWESTKRLINVVEKYKGVITILWHNTSMFDWKLEFYEKLLSYCHERNAWITSGEEIWRWWDENGFVIET